MSLCPTWQQNKWWNYLWAQIQSSLTKGENNKIATVLNTISHTRTETSNPPALTCCILWGSFYHQLCKKHTAALNTSKCLNWMQTCFHTCHYFIVYYTYHAYRKQEQPRLISHLVHLVHLVISLLNIHMSDCQEKNKCFFLFTSSGVKSVQVIFYSIRDRNREIMSCFLKINKKVWKDSLPQSLTFMDTGYSPCWKLSKSVSVGSVGT